MIYLDYNATTPLDERVLSEMLPFLKEEYGNPSSIYSLAQRARNAVEKAREQLAKLINADPKEIIFTSGGTEADNFAIKGIAYANEDKGNQIITSQIEHHAVLNTCKFLERRGFEVTYLPVDKYGVVDLEALEKSITERTILISIMFANNEVGTIQPIEEIARIAKKHGVYFHTDAVQAAGKLPIDVEELGIDLLSLSAHKFYGPKGVGALFVRKGVKIAPLLQGGEQERGRRAGTENVPGIVGLGKAAEIAKEEMEEEEKRVRKLRDELERRLLSKIPEVVLNGHPQNRLYNTLSICVKYVEGESMLINLDREGICASSGSACTSSSLEPSHVLLAMGIPPEIAHGSLRFSFGKFNREEDVEKVSDVLPRIVEELRKISPFWE
ncbi:cysteine desulfurase NifS [bacterium]|nr:cysteine desulfurase NifS [bacterium]